MIDFAYSETAGWFGIHGAAIGSTLSIVFFFVARLFGFRFMFRKIEPGWYPAFLLIIPLTAVTGAAIAVPAFFTVRQFRTLNLERVGHLKIHVTDESNGKIVQYTNPAEVRDVLRLMRNCRGVSHQHDELFDGYVMKVIMDDGESSNLILRVYRKSTVRGSRKAVIAQYRNMEAGEYNCPEIQDWVVRNIDPLFGRPNPQTVPSVSPNTEP